MYHNIQLLECIKDHLHLLIISHYGHTNGQRTSSRPCHHRSSLICSFRNNLQPALLVQMLLRHNVATEFQSKRPPNFNALQSSRTSAAQNTAKLSTSAELESWKRHPVPQVDLVLEQALFRANESAIIVSIDTRSPTARSQKILTNFSRPYPNPRQPSQRPSPSPHPPRSLLRQRYFPQRPHSPAPAFSATLHLPPSSHSRPSPDSHHSGTSSSPAASHSQTCGLRAR
jgi:hypothetical protein